jgi:hypothetical protein
MFLFIYNICMGGFVVTFPYMHMIYPGLVYPLHYSPSSFLKWLWQVSVFHIYRYIKNINHIHLLYRSSFLKICCPLSFTRDPESGYLFWSYLVSLFLGHWSFATLFSLWIWAQPLPEFSEFAHLSIYRGICVWLVSDSGMPHNLLTSTALSCLLLDLTRTTACLSWTCLLMIVTRPL